MAAIVGHGFKPWISRPDMNSVIGVCVALALITAIYKFIAKSWTATEPQTSTDAKPEGMPAQHDETPSLVIEPLEKFDWQATEPTEYLPIKPVYHITMALQQDTPSRLITIDRDYLDRVTLRRSLIDEKGHAVHGYLPRGKESVAELYTYLLRDYLPARYPTMFRTGPDGTVFENTVTGRTFPIQPPEDADAALRTLGETVEEDLFLLHETPGGHLCVAFMCCFPSGFDPSEKFGNLLKDIHAPVPSYSKIGGSMERFFSKLQVGKSVKRLNWSVQTNNELYTLGNHIKDDAAEVVSEDSIDVNQVTSGRAACKEYSAKSIPADLRQTYLRVELQTLTRLPRTQAVLFSFKTYLYGIRQIREQGSGPELADAIEGLKSGNAPGMWSCGVGVARATRVCFNWQPHTLELGQSAVASQVKATKADWYTRSLFYVRYLFGTASATSALVLVHNRSRSRLHDVFTSSRPLRPPLTCFADQRPHCPSY
ncbi:hypothetical protein MHUMG1_01305 [Metarhizium humberi]|uniref:Uncharacterized protein n=1 Tax=Metarhizium humberi TaxID=2596975 RepID=A0A9P8MJ76_9HYPO|nr:hypothetical protein MHUMG1_01305 [Metarhizium humberi]